jgi:riboflavin kinase/FMN adenylyltransferase
MNIIHTADELDRGGRKVCLAIGVFDGVHLGHQQIIRQMIADARQHDASALVVTFDRHPNAVVAPDRVPLQIFSWSQKIRALESLGADALLEIHFDPAFSQKTGEVFIRELARDLGKIHSICVGANFVFGHRRSGNVELLKRLGGGLNFQVHGLAELALDGQTVSSTRIREAIAAGELDAAGQMLGRPYAVCGRVVAGDRLGRQLGFPTANLDVPNRVLPPHGVYAAGAKFNGRFTAWRWISACGQPWRRGRSCGWRRICWILTAIFTARNWRWKSRPNCARNSGLTRWPGCGSRSRGTWRPCGRRFDFNGVTSWYKTFYGSFGDRTLRVIKQRLSLKFPTKSLVSTMRQSSGVPVPASPH